MAIMHPSDITSKKHVPSEEKFFNACRDQLSDKYHVFFSVRWYSEENGIRIDSECDFLIFNPDYGYLCIECKGGKGIYADDCDEWYLVEENEDRKLRVSPYKQAEESMRFFKRYYEEELEALFSGVYGNAVAFPNFYVNTPITIDSPLALTIDLNDMGNLSKRIVEIFKYFNVRKSGQASFFSPDNSKRFIDLINKRIALSIAAGALLEDKERELITINQTQDVVIDMLINYKRAFIVGGAGTGKTWIAIKKLRRIAAVGKRGLYLCCNPVLSQRVKEILDSNEIDVYYFDEFIAHVLGLTPEQLHQRGHQEYSNLLNSIEGLAIYDLLAVDEGQDFTEDWAYCVNLFVKDDGELYVFYDESQNVYLRDFGDKFFITPPPFVLRYNIRNTSNIYQCAVNRTALGSTTRANQVEGVEPDIRVYTRKQQLLSAADSIVNKLVNKEGVLPEKITILCNRSKANSVLAKVNYLSNYRIVDLNQKAPGAITFSTVEDFKGLESDIIIYVNHTYKNEPQTLDLRTLQYTAMTRARFYLYVMEYQVPLMP